MRLNLHDNPIARALGRLCDLVILNILFIICSIPIFTIGAATAALYTVMLKFVKDEEGYIFSGFFVAFKDNFKKATISWLIILVIGLTIAFNFSITGDIGEITGLQWLQLVFIGIFSLFSLILMFVYVYIFPLIARYESPIKNTFVNSILIAIAKLPYTFLLVLIHVLPVIGILFLDLETLVMGFTIWLFVGFSGVAWLNSKILRKVFEAVDSREDQDSTDLEVDLTSEDD